MNNQEHPVPHDLPIGIEESGLRHETDSMGGIDVPADRRDDIVTTGITTAVVMVVAAMSRGLRCSAV